MLILKKKWCQAARPRPHILLPALLRRLARPSSSPPGRPLCSQPGLEGGLRMWLSCLELKRHKVVVSDPSGGSCAPDSAPCPASLPHGLAAPGGHRGTGKGRKLACVPQPCPGLCTPPLSPPGVPARAGGRAPSGDERPSPLRGVPALGVPWLQESVPSSLEAELWWGGLSAPVPWRGPAVGLCSLLVPRAQPEPRGSEACSEAGALPHPRRWPRVSRGSGRHVGRLRSFCAERLGTRTAGQLSLEFPGLGLCPPGCVMGTIWWFP